MAHADQKQLLRDHVPIPAGAGVGLRSQHHPDALNSQIKTAWLEVHSENYFGNGGAPLAYLEQIRANYPISLHGVGMSLGSVDALNYQHLHQLKQLVTRFEPGLLSEHLSWSSFGGRYLNDLLPLPYTPETLAHMVSRIDEVQMFLGRQLLIENPSSYLEFEDPSYLESDFINELARRSGCAILLDVNNLYVSSVNHGWNAIEYIRNIDAARVAEIHLAGHATNQISGRDILIDTHDGPVSEPVWQLFSKVLEYVGPVPTLIEWDADLPAWQILVNQAEKANTYLEGAYAQAA